MAKIMFSLPDQLVARMKTNIPARERSKVLAHLLETEIANREKSLYRRAKELENSENLNQETTIWQHELNQDGLDHV